MAGNVTTEIAEKLVVSDPSNVRVGDDPWDKAPKSYARPLFLTKSRDEAMRVLAPANNGQDAIPLEWLPHTLDGLTLRPAAFKRLPKSPSWKMAGTNSSLSHWL